MTGFQPAFGGGLGGSITTVALVEPGATPTNIIESGLPFTVQVTFRVTGPISLILGGNYRVQVSLEGYGAAAPEVDLPVQVRPTGAFNSQSFAPPFREYIVNVPAPAGLATGAYKVSCLVTHENGFPGPIAGFSDDQTIQIFPNSPITP